MIKSLLLLLCLALALGLGFSIVAVAAPPLPVVDPEPPVDGPPSGYAPEAPSIDAVLEPLWTAPYADATNSLAWGDYDLDGDLDLLVGSFGLNRLYTNLGSNFTETLSFTCASPLPDNTYAVAWGDYDRDGYLDIAAGNFDGKSCTFHNEGNGTFEADWVAEFRQNTTSVAWAGWEVGPEYSAYLALGNADEPNAVYRYEAGDLDLWWTDLSDATTYAVAWGDYDQDGDPDLAVGNFGQANYLYRNDRTGATPLVLAYTTLEADYTTSLAWGDMNGDGWLDLAVGNSRTTGLSDPDRVYCQIPATHGFFLCWTSDDESPTTDVAWGDYDGDGDLDLAAGSESDGLTRVYRNEGGMLDGDPAWDADDEASDSEAVAWADLDGDGDMELAIGYYGEPGQLYENTLGHMITVDVSPHVSDTRSVAWGDMNGDGLLDLAIANSSESRNQVFGSNGQDLVLAWQSPEKENSRSVAWGDFDGDDDLDLAVGNGLQGGEFPNRIYINNGGTLNTSWTFGGGNTYAVAWGDVDGDQDLDLAVGNYETNQLNEIYISGVSQGIPAFTETVSLPASLNDHTLSLAWADVDQDFDLDLAVGNDDGPNRVYLNNPADPDNPFGTYVTLPGSDDTRSVAWGDWNDDGYPDLAVGNAGYEGFVQILETTPVTGGLVFVEVWRSTAAHLDVRSVAWGDYDGDGDLDLGVGVHGQWERRNVIYRNVGGDMVQAWVAPAEDADPTRSVAWGDYDNDGDLDLATGNYVAPAEANRLYVNAWNDETNLANDPTYVVIAKPGLTDNAWHFANFEILGRPVILVAYWLYDDEGDRAFEIEPQISWDGGDHWEPAWQTGGGDGVTNLAASPGGTPHTFAWDVLGQLLAHQGLSIPAPPAESQEEMDVAFRIHVWSNPEHGGLIQRPSFGSDTSLFRVDMRPDWYDSVKLAEPQIVHPGETVEFTLLITQADHGLPPGAIITDPLPAGLSVVGLPDWNIGNLAWRTDLLTWTGALDFEEQLILRFNAEVTLPLTNGLVLDNCAYIFDGLHPQFTRCTTVVISSTPTLTESWKWVNGLPANTAHPGDPLTYTLILTNTGTDNAWHGVLLTDSLPPTVLWADYLTATGGAASYAAGLVTWEGIVNVYEPVTITYLVTVVKPLPGNTLITNTAWVSDGVNPPFYIQPPVTTTILAPDLRSSDKRDSADPVELGDVLTYTLVLSNNGALDASPAVLLDPIPPNCTYVPNSLDWSSGVGGYDPATEAITWTGDVEVGVPVTLTFAITVGAPLNLDRPVLTNTASVEDPIGGLFTVVETTTIWLPDLTASQKWASANDVNLDSVLTYTIVVSNVGGFAAQVQMWDPVPPNAVYVPGSLWSSDGAAYYDAGSDTVFWSGVMTAGHEISLTFAITAGCPVVVDRPVLTNTAYIEDPVGRTVKRIETTDVRLPDLSTSEKKANLAQVEAGGLLTYTVLVRNTGFTAPDVWFVDDLPSGLNWTGSYQASQGTVTYNSSIRQLWWYGGALAKNETATIDFQVQVDQAAPSGLLTNTVEIGYDCDSLTQAVSVEILPRHYYLPVIMKNS